MLDAETMGDARSLSNHFRASAAFVLIAMSMITASVQTVVHAQDTKPPGLTAFERQSPGSQYTNADSLVFRATFDEGVQYVTGDDFAVTGTTATVTNVNAVSDSAYELTVSGGDLADYEGSVGVNLNAGQDIADLSDNPLPAGEPGTDETYLLDNTPPVDPTATSSSHLIDVWDKDATVDIEVSGASDVGGSGVDGFEVEWNQSATWTPTQTKEHEEIWSGATYTATSDGDWYFHIATVDNAGNWTATEHVGPFRIDTTTPSIPIGLTPADGSYTTDTSPILSWDASTDTGGSGIRDADAYRIVVSGPVNRDTYVSDTDYNPTLSEGAFTWKVYARDNAGNTSDYTSDTTLIIDAAKPDVTIDQAGGQADPTNVSPVLFTVIFDEAIDAATFTSADIAVGGTATTGEITITEVTPNDGTTFDVSIVATSDGTVVPEIPGGVVEDLASNTNTASTSTDNSVTVDTMRPIVQNLGVSDLLLSDADAGGALFQVTVSFDETIDTSVEPTLVLSPNVVDGASPTLVYDSHMWMSTAHPTDVYIGRYVVADQDVDLDGITIGVVGAKDPAGNSQRDYVPESEFDIDTLNPEVAGVSVSDVLITDTDIPGDASFLVTIEFSEAMDVGVSPMVSFAPAVTTTLFLDAASGWQDGGTYVARYDVADANDDIENIAVDVTGAQDFCGNVQTNYPPENEFGIDTRNPAVLVVSTSDVWIDDLDTDDQLTLSVHYSETMDTGLDPVITLPPSLAATLIPNVDGWTDGTTYEAIYDIDDADALELGVDIQVDGAVDMKGNAQDIYNGLDQFDVDMLNPSPWAAPTIQIVAAGAAGNGTFLDRYLDLGEGEEPPIAGLSALAAVYEVGELISGRCLLLDDCDRLLRGSYLHIYIYSVDAEARPEGIVLVEHWTVHYTGDCAGYCFAWDSAGRPPGYYDVRLFFPDGSAHVCRIQLVNPRE